MPHLLALYNKQVYYIMEAWDLPRAIAFRNFYIQMYPAAQFDMLEHIKKWQIEQLKSANQFAHDYNVKEYMRVIEHVV